MNANVVAGWWDRPSSELEVRLAPDEHAPAEARVFIREHVRRLGFPKLVDDAALIAVELVTNSVKYASSYGPIWLSVRLAARRPLIEVQDCSPELPEFREPDYVAESGRGLHVVDALCAAFDWKRVDGGKIVWALMSTKVTAPRAELGTAPQGGHRQKVETVAQRKTVLPHVQQDTGDKAITELVA